MQPVTVVVPVLRRPQNAEPFMASLRASVSGDPPPVIAVANWDDEPTHAAWHGTGALVLTCDHEPGSFGQKANDVAPFVSTPWMFLVGDDVAFHPGWLDNALRDLPDHVCVIGTNDLGTPAVRAGHHATHMLIRMDYIHERGASWDGPGTVCGPYRHWYCNPPEAPIWMADLSFKHLGDVAVGDEVMGWERGPAGSLELDRLQVSTVLAVNERLSPLVRLSMESGRAITCTPDHWWRNAEWEPGDPTHRRRLAEWVQPEVGRVLRHVVDETPPVDPSQERLAGWLGGIYDGEGSWIQIAQCPEANPEVFTAIEAALNKLDIPHTVGGLTPGGYFFCLTGKRQAYVDFLNKCQPVKRASIIKKFIGGCRYGQKDRIVAVEPAGAGRVISMTTSTGNYFAWGYASKNCDNELVTVAQLRDVWAHRGDSIVEHLHPYFDRGQMDDVYRLGEEHAGRDATLWAARVRRFAPQLLEEPYVGQ